LISSNPVSEVDAYSLQLTMVEKCVLILMEHAFVPWASISLGSKDQGNYTELVSTCPGLDKLEQLQFVHARAGETCEVAGMDKNTTI